MSEELKPSTDPNAYDFRGNPNEQAPVVSPVPEQVSVPAGETGGYLAPGGTVRKSIRERIGELRPYTSETVPVDEWDTDVEVRSISLGERQAMMQELMDEEGNVEMALIEAHYIARCAFDPETGARIFADDDIEFIQSLPAGTADKVGHVAVRLSGMNEAAKEDAAKK